MNIDQINQESQFECGKNPIKVSDTYSEKKDCKGTIDYEEIVNYEETVDFEETIFNNANINNNFEPNKGKNLLDKNELLNTDKPLM
ncbi:hypothetical protein TSAR_005516 [Trichomalopsis sarcophagae]|uniref:Uncharacterized protein n=1 Tax=Trichomalopsis sarcophagae TaxID=543379 RepID=A0A232EHP2_9HYME|nr:hypothetical protein TSAR_005516 [Trichomalopsis sarcophagae]